MLCEPNRMAKRGRKKHSISDQQHQREKEAVGQKWTRVSLISLPHKSPIKKRQSVARIG
jgi:hypothetical protein